MFFSTDGNCEYGCGLHRGLTEWRVTGMVFDQGGAGPCVVAGYPCPSMHTHTHTHTRTHTHTHTPSFSRHQLEIFASSTRSQQRLQRACLSHAPSLWVGRHVGYVFNIGMPNVSETRTYGLIDNSSFLNMDNEQVRVPCAHVLWVFFSGMCTTARLAI